MAKPIIIRPTDHKSWLEARSHGVGASEVGAIMGVSPFTTAYQLWRLKTGLDGPKEENEAMVMGHLLEDAVAKRWNLAHPDHYIVKASAADIIYVSPEYDYMRVTPDRIVRFKNELGKTDKMLLECKTTSMRIDPECIPTHWLLQCEYQMFVTGIHRCHLAWLTNGRDFGYVDIAYDEALIKAIVMAVTAFWEENVLKGIEPLSVTPEDVKMKNPISVPEKSIEADNMAVNDLVQYRELKAQIKELTKQAEELEGRLQLFMTDSEILTYQGQFLATWRSSKPRETFDAKRFAADHPEMYKNYIKVGVPSRTFKLKDF